MINKKICSKCKIEKDINFFYISKDSKDGYRNECKECFDKKNRKRYEENKERYLEKKRIYHFNNKEKNKDNKRKYYEENKEHILEKALKWQRENVDLANERKKKWNINNSDRRKEIARNYYYRNVKKRSEYYFKNKETISEYKKQWDIRNRERINENRKTWVSNNPQAKLKANISKLIRKALRKRKINKNFVSTWSKILPYSIEYVIDRFESLFKSGMTWENYGTKWHVDHIVPDSWFKYQSIDDFDFKESWDLNNLQPMWKEENIKKGNRHIG